jgi:hypothetical protein
MVNPQRLHDYFDHVHIRQGYRILFISFFLGLHA